MVILLRIGAAIGLVMAAIGAIASAGASSLPGQLGGTVALCVGILIAVCGLGFAGVIATLARSGQTAAAVQLNRTPRRAPAKYSRPETFGGPSDAPPNN